MTLVVILPDVVTDAFSACCTSRWRMQIATRLLARYGASVLLTTYGALVTTTAVHELAQTPTHTLTQRAESLLRSMRTRGRSEVSTREMAHISVALQMQYPGEDGWPKSAGAGKSAEYTRMIRDVYDAAGIRGEERKRIQAAVRAAVGTVMREILSDAELAEAGLLRADPSRRRSERAAHAYSLGAALLRADAGEPDADPVRVLTHVVATLTGRVSTDMVADLAPEVRADVARVAASVEARAREIREAAAL